MRSFLLLVAAAALLLSDAASAAPGLIGRYRLAEGPDVAGELVLTPDGRFRYALAAGALDERAQGRWQMVEGKTCLFTEPKPVASVFSKAPPIAADGAAPTLLVTWPDGRGIAGVDFRLGFDTGEPLEGYTQEYGWSMPESDSRLPRWAELSVPMCQLTSGRIALDDHDHGVLHVILTPNDLGVVNFEAACLEVKADMVILHRKEGGMRFLLFDD
ncbi:hypothetical protein [Rhizorhapis sp. SPR117]|uniref:hypothetical protein n=1 Tax=Rhizorhapis sp. SPR117 TaxID=2912611 RepID=UPI001F32DE10|nr:hypothetical protein [Rhizorhapis sp. SPR117]